MYEKILMKYMHLLDYTVFYYGQITINVTTQTWFPFKASFKLLKNLFIKDSLPVRYEYKTCSGKYLVST